MPNRRNFLQAALAVGALPAAMSLSGCGPLIDVLGDACPEDPAESGGIDWTPDVLHPVAADSREITEADGAPQAMRIYYPSHAFNDTHRILKLCLDRWPLVLFLHGLSPSPPCDSNTPNYLRWRRIPSLLAKSGYVVAVPNYNAVVPEANSPMIDHMLGVIDWLRTSWEDARWVDKRPTSVAVAGHSFGALLAARLAQKRPGMGAFIGLGGSFNQLNTDGHAVLQSLALPSFFMWSDNLDLAPFENLDEGGFWNDVPGPKHAAVHSGGHFDYVPAASSCGDPRGDCAPIEPVAAELIALFLARHMPLARSASNIPINLVPPVVPLTPNQQFYGGGQFPGLKAMKSDRACKGITLRWVEEAVTGSRTLGP
jgi:alpha/beta superfamily hydrolase